MSHVPFGISSNVIEGVGGVVGLGDGLGLGLGECRAATAAVDIPGTPAPAAYTTRTTQKVSAAARQIEVIVDELL
ncbi:MAG TPA: hypothetical protein VJN22_02925 [Candidatus Eremiobacteraceae bacterium]|nr:hypothetical protein [Candidatus Eremiobacteraceae bacterium]